MGFAGNSTSRAARQVATKDEKPNVEGREKEGNEGNGSGTKEFNEEETTSRRRAIVNAAVMKPLPTDHRMTSALKAICQDAAAQFLKNLWLVEHVTQRQSGYLRGK